jgi:predicted metal-binding membrane protein
LSAVTRSEPVRGLGSLARPRTIILVVLLVLSAVGWGLVVWQAATDASMSDSPMSMSMDGDMRSGLELTMGMAPPVFLAMWVAMMVAMMFPAAAPMMLLFDRVQRAKREAGRSYVPTAYFVGAYLALWTAFGAIAFALAVGVDRLAADSDWVSGNWARLGGVLLIAAGIYQLTPLKQVCLAKCRTPLSFLMTSWRDGKVGAVQMGLLHGVYCLGCCWLLFVILLPLGIMNVAAMVVIALLVFGEKCLSIGHRLAHAAALVLVVYGLIVTVIPDALPTTVS